MRRDPKLLRMLRDATREATQDLDKLSTIGPGDNPRVEVLRHELRKSLAKGDGWVANEARSQASRAKQASARHRLELMDMKKTAQEAAENLQSARTRRNRTKAPDWGFTRAAHFSPIDRVFIPSAATEERL